MFTEDQTPQEPLAPVEEELTPPDEAAQYRAALAQLSADFANYKRRTATIAEQATHTAQMELVRALLGAIDAIDLAEAHAPGDTDPVHRLITTALSGAGLARFGATDDIFDPNEYEAAERVDIESTHTESVVLSVLRPGYRWNGSLLRPATVRVGVPIEAP